MKKGKERKYEAPLTTRTQVSLENGFCASSADVKNPDRDNGRIEEHQVNEDFDFTFTDQDWDRE